VAIIRTAGIFTISDLQERLTALSAAVVRVLGDHPGQKEASGLCTGWFLTPRLVIAPGYAVVPRKPSSDRFTNIRVQSYGPEGEPWECQAVAGPEALGQGLLKVAPDEWAAGLLILERPWPGPLLEFSFDTPERGDLVTVIQFPEARPPPSVSFGQVRAVNGTVLSYDASSVGGSGGAPVLDRNWRVVGMHMGYDGQQNFNSGLTRAALMEMLRTFASWPEISQLHRIADSDAALRQLHESSQQTTETPSSPPSLLWAALLPAFDSDALTPADREALHAKVVDPKAPRWVLRPDERRSLIQSAGSLAALREHLRPGNSKDPAYRAISALLKGPPYRTSGANEEELAWWIQISSWFEGIAPRLPGPDQFAKLLARCRVRARLERAMGRDFRGRAGELRSLRSWYKARKRPLLLTGVGGIGKSALIARFALSLPRNTLLLWLDFDRADLAPDDAVSVLSAITEQAEAQLEGFKAPALTSNAWESNATELGKRLATALSSERSALLVLDSFEAAQYAERYQELWPVLEAVTKPLHTLRVAVTGRAPVPGLTLRDRKAVPIHLPGLSHADAKAWLQSKGVRDAKVLKRVLELADGIPLILRLAVRFVEAGGRVADLPEKLPPAIVAGYLYERILNRVQSPEFKPLAMGVLVLRRLSIEMLTPVLGGLLTFPSGEQSEWFPELTREMSLVEGTQTITVRPEVRSATLRLIEREHGELVRSIDERAAKWYASLNSDDPTALAELVYHRLRLGDIVGAEQVWRPECGALLIFAAEEIRDNAARKWLEARLGNLTTGVATLALWEQDAHTRILGARTRRLDRNVSRILKERSQRTPDSPLIFQEAFELRERGKRKQAVALLESVGEAKGPIERNRIALRALLANDADDRVAADVLLSRIDNHAVWSDRRNGSLEALCVQAARIWVRTDLDAECKLISRLRNTRARRRSRRVLVPLDVILPRLRRCLTPAAASLERSVVRVDVDAEGVTRPLIEGVEQERLSTLRDEPPGTRRHRIELINRPNPQAPLELESSRALGLHGARDDDVTRLAQLGWSRWRYVSAASFLRDAAGLSKGGESTNPPMEIAILGTLALFATPAGNLRIAHEGVFIGDAILSNYVLKLPWQADEKDWVIIKRLLDVGVDPDFEWDTVTYRVRGHRLVLWPQRLVDYRPRRAGTQVAGLGPFLLSLVSRDPLTQLVSDLAGQATEEF
jgi:V8-like Glu-specific endopeptidase